MTTPLHDAIQDYDDHSVFWMVRHRVNVNSRDANGNTPLMLAARGLGLALTVQVLIEHGADTGARDRSGRTPWMIALDNGALDNGALEHLQAIEERSPVTTTPEDPFLSLLYAIYTDDGALFRRAYDSGGDLNRWSERGETPLHFASRLGRHEMVRTLLHFGADVNLASGERDSLEVALHVAVEEEHIEVVRLLLEHGAQIEARDSLGQSPLMLAAYDSHHAIVALLLEHGADSHAIDPEGYAPLAYALFSPAVDLEAVRETVSLLLRHGGEQHDARQLRTALRGALRHGKGDIADLLIAAGATFGLVEAVLSKDLDRVAGFLEQGTLPEERDEALVRAAKYSNVEMVKLLLRYGANPNATDRGERALIEAFLNWFNTEPILRELIRAGADVNAPDDEGQTALTTRPDKDYWREFEFLVRSGADIDSVNGSGQTALMRASMNGSLRIVNLLLRKGCKVNVQDSRGRTALLYAVENGHTRIVRRLVAHNADTEVRDIDGRTPQSLARRWPGKSIQRLLASARTAK